MNRHDGSARPAATKRTVTVYVHNAHVNSASEEDTMTASDLNAILERYAIKRGALLSNLADADRRVVLCLAARVLRDDAVLPESEINLLLDDWLADEGAGLHIDRAELRRTLIDAGLWQRDAYGREYRRAAVADAALADCLQQLAQLDAGAVIRAARAAHAASRAERARQHAQRQTS